ncbi:MAG: PIG-L family deacetylase [Thermoanaerobaculia bacterium]
MIPEAEAIPYEPSPLTGERLLVLAPHPDDEVIGCGGVIARHLRDNRRVRVVIATDGTAADPAQSDRDAYRIRREAESSAGLALLGPGVEVLFLRFHDRELSATSGALAMKIRENLEEFRPDLILVPSPIEIHPDHLALSHAFCDVVQNDASIFADLAIARVAFYEVNQPIRPNTLVDITDVADIKFSAIAAHKSQLAVRNYSDYTRGLNAFRTMTLPPTCRFAEAYFVLDLPALRTTSFTSLQRTVGEPRVEVMSETVPISVIVRTKDRPALLHEAVASITASAYPAEIVVVNDGGEQPELSGVKLVHHPQSRGRSEAMNSGVAAATNPFIAFLDDDDLYHPDHLATLGRASEQSQYQGWYTNAVSAFVRLGESGLFETRSRQRLFDGDFDRERLLIDNYIPLPTLLVRRDTFLDLGGFDPEFDLFEDWDFLIRLSLRGDLLHVPRITCEIRHIEGSGSITMESPEGSDAFREAKMHVWRKHADLVDFDVFARVFEKEKQRRLELQSSLVDEKGRRGHIERDVDRLEREKQSLIAQIGALHETLNERTVRLHAMEAVENQLRHAQVENERKAVELSALRVETAQLRPAVTEAQTTISALYAEVQRLQSLLDQIYGSRTWKLHTIVEKMRGRD